MNAERPSQAAAGAAQDAAESDAIDKNKTLEASAADVTTKTKREPESTQKQQFPKYSRRSI